jgi:hypothetical protein
MHKRRKVYVYIYIHLLTQECMFIVGACNLKMFGTNSWLCNGPCNMKGSLPNISIIWIWLVIPSWALRPQAVDSSQDWSLTFWILTPNHYASL